MARKRKSLEQLNQEFLKSLDDRKRREALYKDYLGTAKDDGDLTDEDLEGAEQGAEQAGVEQAADEQASEAQTGEEQIAKAVQTPPDKEQTAFADRLKDEEAKIDKVDEDVIKEAVRLAEEMERQKAEQERIRAEEEARAEAERAEQERIRAEEEARAEAERAEQERIRAEEEARAEAERVEQERIRAEEEARAEAERAEQEAKERQEFERRQAEEAERERKEQQRIAAQEAEQERRRKKEAQKQEKAQEKQRKAQEAEQQKQERIRAKQAEKEALRAAKEELKLQRRQEKEDKRLRSRSVSGGRSINYRRFVLVMVMLVVVLGGVAFGLYTYLGGDSKPATTTTQTTTGMVGIQSGIMPGMSDQEIYDWNNKTKDTTVFEVNFNKNLVFEDTTSVGHILIINPRYSAYPLSVELVIRENNMDRIVYTSDILYPEQYLANIRLDFRVEKGVYDAYALFKYYDQTGKSEVGRHKASMSITIKK